MLHFLVLCTFLQTLCRKSLAHPLAPSSGVAANIIAPQQCPAAPENGQQLRSVHDIVQSCLFTIFACIWTSIHPNINGSRDSWWTCVKRKVVTTLCAVIAPEVVLLWALRQRFSAQQIAERYNKEFKTLGMRLLPLCYGFNLILWFRRDGGVHLGEIQTVVSTPSQIYNKTRTRPEATMDNNTRILHSNGRVHFV